MRKLILIGGLLLTACPSKTAAPPAAPAPSGRTMPIAADAPLETGLPDQARVRTDLSAAREAIQRAQQTSGQAPASLNDLGLRLSYPADMVYDPAKGTISSKTYPQY